LLRRNFLVLHRKFASRFLFHGYPLVLIARHPLPTPHMRSVANSFSYFLKFTLAGRDLNPHAPKFIDNASAPPFTPLAFLAETSLSFNANFFFVLAMFVSFSNEWSLSVSCARYRIGADRYFLKLMPGRTL